MTKRAAITSQGLRVVGDWARQEPTPARLKGEAMEATITRS